MPKRDKSEQRHIRNLIAFNRQIDAIYNAAAKEAAAIGMLIHDFDQEKPFSFEDFPQTRKRIGRLLDDLNRNLSTTIVNGITSSWALANHKNNELVYKVLGKDLSGLPEEVQQRYLSTNPKALEAFKQRQIAGLKLSDRVWNYTNQFKAEIELGLDLGIRSGMTAPELARSLKQYLRYPDKLFRRVRDEHGQLHLSKAAAAFHPGQGVYRSSYKNARRLAVTECNIAYRTADHLRYQELDFVVGIHIHISKENHPVRDICDDLEGRYPKDFKFTGWHPHCRCYVTTVLKTMEEIKADNQRILQGQEPTPQSENSVKEPPRSFNDWISQNRERAKGWETMPYFVRDNPQYVENFRVDTYNKHEKTFTRHRHTSSAMQESLGKYLQAKYPNIANTQKAAIVDYCRGDVSDFRQLNKQLRNGNLSEFNAAFSELLSQALYQLPAEECTVYRTIRLNKTNLQEWIELANQHKDITFKGFTSTSRSKKAAIDFIESKAQRRKNNETDILLVINGKTGHPISDFSKFKEQQEFLFDKGLNLRFINVEFNNGKFLFYLEERH